MKNISIEREAENYLTRRENILSAAIQGLSTNVGMSYEDIVKGAFSILEEFEKERAIYKEDLIIKVENGEIL